MHSCCLLITKEFPTKDVISKIMSKYDENDFYEKEEPDETKRPLFMWDYYLIGGRYNGLLKLKIDIEDEKYLWKYFSRVPRNGRLFWSYLLSACVKHPYSEDDYLGSMGFNDNFLYVDGAFVKDIINFDSLECYCCIDKNGMAISCSSWNGDNFIKDYDFETKLKKVKEESTDCFATILDLHD